MCPRLKEMGSPWRRSDTPLWMQGGERSQKQGGWHGTVIQPLVSPSLISGPGMGSAPTRFFFLICRTGTLQKGFFLLQRVPSSDNGAGVLVPLEPWRGWCLSGTSSTALSHEISEFGSHTAWAWAGSVAGYMTAGRIIKRSVCQPVSSFAKVIGED